MKIISIIFKINGMVLFSGIIFWGFQKYRLYSKLSDQIHGMIYYFIPALLLFIAYFIISVNSHKLNCNQNILLRHRIGAYILASVPWIIIILCFIISNYVDSRHGIPILGIFIFIIPIAIIIYLIIGIILFYFPCREMDKNGVDF